MIRSYRGFWQSVKKQTSKIRRKYAHSSSGKKAGATYGKASCCPIMHFLLKGVDNPKVIIVLFFRFFFVGL